MILLLLYLKESKRNEEIRMNIKKYIKRVGKYILHGVPNVQVSANISQLSESHILTGRKIGITGGGRGLGLSIAQKCVAEGANILIVGRNEDTLISAQKKIGKKCQYLSFDVSDIANIETFILKAKKLLGGLDSIVCNAGISLHEKNILDVSVEGFEKQLRTNLEGNYFLAKYFIKNRDKNKDCKIIFISSERGFQCDDIPYGLTKASINSLTRGLARRFYRDNININAVAPGVTASDMTGRDASGNLFSNDQVAGRFFLPEEVAEITVFLLSNRAKCISGEIIACDAGQYISSYY